MALKALLLFFYTLGIFQKGSHEDSGIEITWFTIITTLSVVLPFCCVAAAVLLIRKHMNK